MKNSTAVFSEKFSYTFYELSKILSQNKIDESGFGVALVFLFADVDFVGI